MNPNVLYDLEKYHPDVFKRFAEFKNQFLYTCILQNLKRGIEEEMYRKDMDPEIITRLRLANILLAMNIELFPAHQFRPADIEREIVTHFLNGIVTPKGALEIRKYNYQFSAEKTVLA